MFDGNKEWGITYGVNFFLIFFLEERFNDFYIPSGPQPLIIKKFLIAPSVGGQKHLYFATLFKYKYFTLMERGQT